MVLISDGSSEHGAQVSRKPGFLKNKCLEQLNLGLYLYCAISFKKIINADMHHTLSGRN